MPLTARGHCNNLRENAFFTALPSKYWRSDRERSQKSIWALTSAPARSMISPGYTKWRQRTDERPFRQAVLVQRSFQCSPMVRQAEASLPFCLVTSTYGAHQNFLASPGGLTSLGVIHMEMGGESVINRIPVGGIPTNCHRRRWAHLRCIYAWNHSSGPSAGREKRIDMCRSPSALYRPR